LFDGIHDVDVLGRFAVDLDDQVARFDTGLVGGGIFDGRDHRENALHNFDFGSDALIGSARSCLQFLVHIPGQIETVGIKCLDHPVDRPVEKLFHLHWLDVVLLNDVQDIAEGSEPLVCAAFDGRNAAAVSAGNEQHQNQDEQETGFFTEKSVHQRFLPLRIPLDQ
jgi:hypothetical protein